MKEGSFAQQPFLQTVKIEEGLLDFHLRKIKKLVRQTEKGTYLLSEDGRSAYDLVNCTYGPFGAHNPDIKAFRFPSLVQI